MNPNRSLRLKWLFGYGPGIDPVRNTVSVIAWLALIVGGPLLGLIALDRYWLLVGQRFWLGALAGLIGGAFAFWRLGSWPRGLGYVPKAVASLGFSVAALFLVSAVIAFANGTYSMDQTRKVNCVAKHHSYGRNIDYYLDVKPWYGSEEVVTVKTSERVYEAVQPPATVRLETARGYFGIEWVRHVTLDSPSP